MKNNLASYLVLSILMSHLFSVTSFANDKVAKAIIARGNVKAVLPDGSEVKIEKGTWLDEGAKVKTEPKSFVKFLFTDKSQMNLGPNSEMEIAKFDKKEAGIINLMKGSLRSKVTKNYLEKGEKDKSKLFVKTNSAAMGVRGTDFMVTFDPATNHTNLDVISGAVAMAPLDVKDIAGGATQNNILEKIVSGKKAVMVEKGQFSRAEPGMQKAQLPSLFLKINWIS